MSTNSPDLSIVIVSWNVRELVRANLSRLFSLNPSISFEVFVVDNDSQDGTAHMIRSEFPAVHLITNTWDAGFATANNQALRLATGRNILLLNPDMLVEPGALETTVRQLDADQTIGVLGIKLVTKDGAPINNVRRFPTFGSQLAIIFKLVHVWKNLNAQYMATDFDYTKSQDVDSVRGSFFAFSRKTMDRVGVLDADYHIWFEEVDYCKRIHHAGLRVRYCAEATAQDYVGRSAAQMSRTQKQIIFTASMYRFFKKWHPEWESNMIFVCRPIGIISAWFADGMDNLKRVPAFFRSV